MLLSPRYGSMVPVPAASVCSPAPSICTIRWSGEVAAFKGTAEAITFSSGYLANLAVIASLLTPQDRVILDALSHRSLVDACRLAGAPLQRFRHNDMDSLRHELSSGAPANRTLIIADGVFSMDGDICKSCRIWSRSNASSVVIS